MAPVRDGVTVGIRLIPRAGRDRIEGIAADASGAPRLRIAVTAPPAEGKANEALLRLLAKAWRLPKTRLSIAMGASGRDKLLHVAGDAEALRVQLAPWIEQRDG